MPQTADDTLKRSYMKTFDWQSKTEITKAKNLPLPHNNRYSNLFFYGKSHQVLKNKGEGEREQWINRWYGFMTLWWVNTCKVDTSIPQGLFCPGPIPSLVNVRQHRRIKVRKREPKLSKVQEGHLIYVIVLDRSGLGWNITKI